MKNLVFLLAIFIVNISYAQIIFGEQQIISSNADGASSVFASDIDNDGDIDVLSSSNLDDKIVWYENNNQGVFTTHLISNNLDLARNVYVNDLDGDQDKDVLVFSAFGRFSWYENLDGLGNFGEVQVISINSAAIGSYQYIDFDLDDDIDIFSTYNTPPGGPNSTNKTIWNENNGFGDFGDEQLIAGPLALFNLIDFDNDGDIDILAENLFGGINGLFWVENINNSFNFDNPNLIFENFNAQYNSKFYVIDIENDNDLDIISYENGIVYLYENSGQNTFNEAQIIVTNINRVLKPVDLDLDGDIDLIISSQENNKIVWYENDGLNNFGQEQIITTNAIGWKTVFTADLDNDGDLDILSSSYEDNKIAWYENLETLATNEILKINFSIYPIPTTNVLTIKSKTKIIKIEIYNNLGQLVLLNTNQNTINISNLSKGLFLVKIEGSNGNFGVKKVIKK